MLSVVVDGEKSTNIPSRGLYKANVECSGGTTGEWDYNAWNLIINNAETNSKCNISFTSNLTQEEYDKYIEAGKSLRRNTYRGKDITSYHTDGSLYEMISSGRFDDIYVGDYITANDVKWLVADIDNYLYTGQTSLTKHHLTIVPYSYLTTAAMNSNNTMEGGYANSEMKQNILQNLLNTVIKPVFGNHILTYSTKLTTAIDAASYNNSGSVWLGAANAWEWYESQIDLMSEKNVFGADTFSASGFDTGIDNRQYALFQLRPEYINSDGESFSYRYQLKNISSLNSVVAVVDGISGTANASDPYYGVRPRFLIG